jgi:purine nucleosidase
LKNIILFADTGIDDAITIIYALQNPNINLLAIVAGYGNIDRNKTYRNTKYLLELADREDIPVIAGATRPLDGSDPTFFPDIHGVEGLGPIKPPIPEERFADQTNFSRLFQIIKEFSEDITIVNTGRLTSLAVAWYLSPSTMEKVKETYVMGGAFLVPGNATEVAEANFNADSLAANFVSQNVPDLTIIPLNVTREALITPLMAELINEQADTPLQELIFPILEFYYNAYQQLEPGIQGTPQHDLAALMAALQLEGLFHYERRYVKVQHEMGYANGLSIADFSPGSSDCFGTNCVKIATEIDYDLFASNVFEILTSS